MKIVSRASADDAFTFRQTDIRSSLFQIQELIATLDKRYIDGRISDEMYEIELERLTRLLSQYTNGQNVNA